MSLVRLFGIAARHLLPRRIVEGRVKRKLSPPGYRFSPRFSGRVALFELASDLRRSTNRPVALVPDYVCNIVPRVLSEAGWTVEPYACNDKLEADWQELLARTRRGDVGLLVSASVFGSSALLDELAESTNLQAFRSLNISVIVDLAQDVRLVRKLPAEGADVVSSIVSFNDKSFPGAMGGGIISGPSRPAPSKPIERGALLALYKRVLFANVKGFLAGRRPRKEKPARSYDYSLCEQFPFRIKDNYRPAKLQLVCAMQGLSRLAHHEAAKLPLLAKNAHLETRFASTAAYLIMRPDSSVDNGRKRKRPYAVEGRPETSLRPDETILHNKGFDDHEPA